jgi:hypothetical protein
MARYGCDPMVFKLTRRVTFGLKPSPDMASFVVLKIADEHQESHPDAAGIPRDDRYMDDFQYS